MQTQVTQVTQDHAAAASANLAAFAAVPRQQLQLARLPFTIRKAASAGDLRLAAQVRQAGYARHAPGFAATLAAPEPQDTAADTVVLLALSKHDGRAVGTMRIQVNQPQQMTIAQQVKLPEWLDGQRLASASRLAVEQGMFSDTLRIALFKAFFLHAQQEQAAWSVVAARRAMARMYQGLLFRDILDGATFQLSPALDVPHQILALETASARRRWKLARHPLFSFMFETVHPDIDIHGGAPFGTVAG